MWLGEDTHGVWLGAKAGSIHQRGHEPRGRILRNQVHLVPRHDWWVFTFNPTHPKATHWIDTSTPATFEDHRVTTVDLDLDVVRGPGGRLWIEDEDEFAEHQLLYGYPRDMIEQAERATTEMVQALSELREPFDGVASAWLARVTTV